MAEITDEQRETLRGWLGGDAGLRDKALGIVEKHAVAVLLADERAAREAAEARYEQHIAALAALADSLTVPGRSEPCEGGEDCCGIGRCDAMETRHLVVGASDLRALLADPAAVLADRDRRMKAEAIRGAITALRQGAENLSLGDDVVSYLRGAERAATEHADREGGRV